MKGCAEALSGIKNNTGNTVEYREIRGGKENEIVYMRIKVNKVAKCVEMDKLIQIDSGKLR